MRGDGAGAGGTGAELDNQVVVGEQLDRDALQRQAPERGLCSLLSAAQRAARRWARNLSIFCLVNLSTSGLRGTRDTRADNKRGTDQGDRGRFHERDHFHFH